VLVAIDVGDKRVGVALSDELEKFARPFDAWARAGGKAEREILRVISERQPSSLIVGLPLNEEGTQGEQVLKTRRFCERLVKRSGIKVIYVDEYLSSVEAEQLLAAKGRRHARSGKKGMIDAFSAAIILQRHIDSVHKE
jgi:putative holliday junction resolvase